MQPSAGQVFIVLVKFSLDSQVQALSSIPLVQVLAQGNDLMGCWCQ